MPNIDTHNNMYKRFLTRVWSADDEGVIERGVCVCVCRTLDLTGGGGGGNGGERQRGASEQQPSPPITRCALHNNNNNALGADLSGTHIYIVRSELRTLRPPRVLLTILSLTRIYIYNNNIIITYYTIQYKPIHAHGRTSTVLLVPILRIYTHTHIL